MVSRVVRNFSEYIKNIGKEMIDDRLRIHSQSYDDAIASLKGAISSNEYISSLDFNVDEYIDRYLEDHPYDGDEFSPFYMVGELPVIIPYAYRKLNISDDDKYIHEYFIRVIDIKGVTEDTDISSIHESIKDLTTSYARKVMGSRMKKMLDFLTSFDYLKPAAFTFVEFILQYFKYVYGESMKYIEYKFNDILTSDVLMDVCIDGNYNEVERSRLYLYLLCIEGYLTFFNKDKFPDNTMISLYIFRAKESYGVYLNLYQELIDYSNKIDLSDDIFQALTDKIMNFALFYLMPEKYLEENLRDEKSAKELLKIL